MIKAEIQNLRKKIDQIDNSIAKLLSERISCSKQIGLLKDKLRDSSENDKIGAYDPIRENQIIEQLKVKFDNIPFNGIEIIFRQIISLCRNYSHKSTLCLLGKFDGFDYKNYFGNFCSYINCQDTLSWLKELNKNTFNVGLSECLIDEKTKNDLYLSGFEQADILINNNQTCSPIRVYYHK